MNDQRDQSQSGAVAVRAVHLPAEGFLRLNQILAPNGPIPVGRSTWWTGVKTGHFPKHRDAFGGRITIWAVENIRALIASGSTGRRNVFV